MSNIKSKGQQAFNVPNNAEGRAFVNLFSKYRNSGNVRIRTRGRGTRKYHGSDTSIAIEHSEWMAVYFDNHQQVEKLQKIYREKWEAEQALKKEKAISNRKQFALEAIQANHNIDVRLNSNLNDLVDDEDFRALKKLLNNQEWI